MSRYIIELTQKVTTFSTSLYITPCGNTHLHLNSQSNSTSWAVDWVSYEVVIEFVRLISVMIAIHEDRRRYFLLCERAYL